MQMIGWLRARFPLLDRRHSTRRDSFGRRVALYDRRQGRRALAEAMGWGYDNRLYRRRQIWRSPRRSPSENDRRVKL